MDWSAYYPKKDYPTNPAKCPACSFEAPDPEGDEGESILSSMGWADCPEHGRWCFAPSPERIEMTRLVDDPEGDVSD